PRTPAAHGDHRARCRAWRVSAGRHEPCLLLRGGAGAAVDAVEAFLRTLRRQAAGCAGAVPGASRPAAPRHAEAGGHAMRRRIIALAAVAMLAIAGTLAWTSLRPV